MGRHRDMRQHCDLQTVASSGAVVTCVAGTCAPAPRSTTLEVTAPGTCHCVCVCQAWPGFQQMVFFMWSMWSRDLWRQAKAVSSVSISILLSIESIRCDDNFGAEVISSRSPTPQKLSAAQMILEEIFRRHITSMQIRKRPSAPLMPHVAWPFPRTHCLLRTSLHVWSRNPLEAKAGKRQTSGQGRNHARSIGSPWPSWTQHVWVAEPPSAT